MIKSPQKGSSKSVPQSEGLAFYITGSISSFFPIPPDFFICIPRFGWLIFDSVILAADAFLFLVKKHTCFFKEFHI